MHLDLELYARMVSNVAVPILLGNATLLGLVSLRNQHVSDRARANVLEAIYSFPTAKLPHHLRERRIKDLQLQNKLFIRRYQVSSAAFLCLLFTLCFFATTCVLSFQGGDGKPSTFFLAGCFALAGSILGIIGFLLLVYEFARGAHTLKSNNETLESLSVNDLDNVDARPLEVR
jgi:hypothetical protein